MLGKVDPVKMKHKQLSTAYLTLLTFTYVQKCPFITHTWFSKIPKFGQNWSRSSAMLTFYEWKSQLLGQAILMLIFCGP